MTVPVIQYIWRGYNLAPENYSGWIGISQNTKCDILVGFPKSGHILTGLDVIITGRDSMHNPGQTWIFYKPEQFHLTRTKHDQLTQMS